ncbi:MAG TPA: PKD domain-containing protein, partial [Solirubrobacteraceae bacterium]|nr:PKD domain-containing protein [Solirubrobacteraceae bacterium]
MRRGRRAWILACTALVCGIAAAPAHAAGGVYAVQANAAGTGGALVQYTVGAGGALTASLPDLALSAAPRDITVTPDGHFAYVLTVAPDGSTAIAQFDRITPAGRLLPNAQATTAATPGPANAIIVNPQGTRVLYGQAGSIVARPIIADGSLGAPSATPIPSGATTADVQSLAMTADGRSLYASDTSSGAARVWQFDVDPASGAIAPKSTPVVGWPDTSTGGAGRMAITPSGSHLYLAADSAGFGIGRWAIDPATGALVGGSVEAPPSDRYAEGAVATSAPGDALWAPSSSSASTFPERIRQFAIGAAGVLTPLVPPAVNYVVAGPAHDLVLAPDGQTLYLGQDGTVGEWVVGPGGALSHRANVPPGPAGGVQNAGIALSPSRAPVAAFSVSPAPAGQPTAFDASTSNDPDPDGAIARYDWNFGDGTVVLNGGPTPSHTYATAGTRTATLVVTDADGTATAALWTGTRMLRDGGPSAQTTRSFTIAAVDTSGGTPPRPHKGRSVTVAAERGTILVRVPGSRRYVPIG